MPRKRAKVSAEYVEGAIVSIKLRDFMTYSSFEFCPGPRMNLILGPNGAGKSTILCAISLGLGGTPSSVGRSGTVAQYIKHNRNKAFIAIELYSQSTNNYVVSREILSNNQSVWMINGKSSNQKGVDQLMAKLNIQMKNLCQFLPQERVVEFVRMSNEELLESTEKAADINMWESHNKLKEWYKKSHGLDQTYARVNEEFERETERNSHLQEQVKLYNVRRKHLDKITNLKKKKAWMTYQQANDNYVSALAEEKEKTKEMQNINADIQPLLALIDKSKLDIVKVESAMKSMATSIQKSKDATSKLTRQYENLTEKSNEAMMSYKAKQKEEEERHKSLYISFAMDTSHIKLKCKNSMEQKQKLRWNGRKTRTKIKSQILHILKQQLKEFENQLSRITEVDDEQINSELNEVQKSNSELVQRFNRIQTEKDGEVNQKQDAERELNYVDAELKRQQDVHQAKMRLLNQKDRETHDVANWINNNRDKFKRPVHGPIMITINVKDAKNAKYIERAIPFKDMMAFVCEDKSDMELLLDTAKQSLKKRINAVMAPSKETEYKPHVPLDAIRKFGFHSFLIDMIEAPNAVMAYLCQQYRIYSVPVGTEQTRLRVSEVTSTTNLRSFYTENNQYSCKQSKYGNKVTSTRSSVLNPARLLTFNVDAAKVQSLKDSLEQWRGVKTERERRIAELTTTEKEIKMQLEECRTKMKELNTQKHRRNSIRVQIEQKKTNIEALENRKIDMDQEKATRNKKLGVTNNEKILLIGRHEKVCSAAIPVAIERVLQACKLRVHMQEKNKLQIQIQDRQGDIVALQREIECLKRRTAILKETVRTLMRDAQTICGMSSKVMPESLLKDFAVLPDAIEDLDNEIFRLQSKADCMRTTNEGAINEHRESQAKLEDLGRQKRRLEDELKVFGTSMEEVKTQWLAPLQELLNNVNKRFSHYLSTLRCAGEVGLKTGDTDNDFAKYGICIKVKYRDGDPLRELTQFYQSGGERSVATVLYLLSLQEFVKLPFCCVDEINQGMDSTNERRVFQLMTQILCSETNSQYFLVTPKLLPDLEFHDNVQVNYVVSGDVAVKENVKMVEYIQRSLNQTRDQ